MNTIHTLTVNGSTYALPDPKSVLDDSAKSPDTTWSSQKISQEISAVDDSGAIVCDAAGEQIALTDASNRALQGLKLFGRTTQNGTPTPDSPIALESLGDGGSITVTVSGGAAEQSLTLSTPNGLPGIPVASGGNYTDENGQQWICDEIDFARGVYVQRIAKVTIDGTQALGLTVSAAKRLLYYIPGVSEATAVCSGSLQAGNWTAVLTKLNVVGATADYIGLTPDWLQTMTTANEAALYLENHPIIVMYSLPVLVETTLSTEDIAAYAALHSNKPNTTVYNDASAHMALRYVADTKAYIDNKFNELAAAIVNNT